MAKGNVTLIVATEAPAGADERFNKWYNEVHIPMLFKYKGMKRVSRLQQAGQSQGEAAKYLAIYEFESAKALEDFNKSPILAEAMQEMQTSWKQGGLNIKWMGAYAPIKVWEK